MTRAISRRAFVRRGAAGGLAVLAAGGVGAPALASPGGPREALRTALTLEYLQARLYARAVGTGSIRPELLALARVAAGHERVHIAALRGLLGRDAGPPPHVDLRGWADDDRTFAHRAIALEDLAVGAMNGMAAALGPEALSVTASIASVDAGHAAWMRGLVGVSPEHRVRDAGRTAGEVADALRRAGIGTGVLS